MVFLNYMEIDNKTAKILKECGPLADAAVRALNSKKGEQLVIIDVRGISMVTDFYLLATGKSAPQLKALASESQTVLKSLKGSPVRVGGSPESGWLIVDAGDLVVHVFSEDMRGYYNLEELWNDAGIYALQ